MRTDVFVVAGQSNANSLAANAADLPAELRRQREDIPFWYDIGDGRVFAPLDFDRDGWQDIALRNNNTPAFALYPNTIGAKADPSRHHFNAFRFVGGNRNAMASTKWSNCDGYGVKLAIECGDQTLIREHRCGEGLAAQNSTTVIVGIGEHAQVGGVTARWPGAGTHDSGKLRAGQLVTIYEDPKQSPTAEAFVVEPYQKDGHGVASPRPEPKASKLRLMDQGKTPGDLVTYTTTATWCPNCKAGLPRLARLCDQFTTNELTMYGVPSDPGDMKGKLSEYRSEYDPAYELLVGLSADQLTQVSAQAKRASLGDGLPITIVTDSDGDVVFTTWGVPSVSDLRRLRMTPNPPN